ncbi:MAG: helix-turn-helix domain-containing protein [Coriobacteriia bacterium]|nr:helix-turn-helix domain-containing protein [Coriobacteriia bacterium]
MGDKGIQQQVGERIRSLRCEKTGLSQEKFALKIGMDRTYFSAIELGRHSVTIGVLAKIADGLGVTLETLFQGM